MVRVALPHRPPTEALSGAAVTAGPGGGAAPGGATAPADVLLILGAIGSVQVSAAVATGIFDEVGPLGATALRATVAGLVLVAVVRPRLRGLDRATLAAVVPYGLALGVMNLAFYLGIDRVPLGTAVAIEFLGPLGVGAWFARRHRDRAWVVVAALGVLALTRPWSEDGADLVGVAWLLLAAACWAAYIPLGARAGRGLPGLQPVALAMVVGALVALPAAGIDGFHGGLSAHVLLIGLVAGVAGSVVPYSLELLALRRVAPGVFGVLMALEPGVAALTGFALLGQDLGVLPALGLALVVAAGVGITRAPGGEAAHGAVPPPARAPPVRPRATPSPPREPGPLPAPVAPGRPDRDTPGVPANLPNALTVLRILLVPVMVVALAQETGTGDLVAAFVFWLASITDWFDGWLARRSNLITNFGKLADPIADKLLVIAALVMLVGVDRVAAWVAVVVIGRELAVTLTRAIAAQQGEVIAAAWLGKVKTSFQILVILLLILIPDSHAWLDLLVYAMVAITLWSGVDYFLGLRRTMAAGRVPADRA